VDKPNPVNPDAVYATNAKGWQQLMGGSTSLSDVALRFLVLVDGKLSLGQIAQQLPGVSQESLGKTVFDLEQKGFIEIAKPATPGSTADSGTIDFFADNSSDAPDGTEQDADKDFVRRVQEAQRIAAALKQQGYFVSIAQQAAGAGKPLSGNAFSVLVVEDSASAAQMVRRFLELEGFVTRIAAKRDEVVEALRQSPPPDLMLVDVTLPDISGYDILKQVRKHPALKRIPIIMMTASASRKDVLSALADGANGYVTKPFEFDVLLKSIKAVLGIE
jgi:two-component system OmpR family response regulator